MSALNMWHLFSAARRRRAEQWKSPQQLAHGRGHRLQRLCRAAGKTSYYREAFRNAGLSPDRVTEPTLQRLSVLEKATLHASAGVQMLTEPADKLFPVTTSGSTGTPVRVLRSHRDQAEVSALWARIFHAYGHRLRDTQLNINTGATVASKGPVAAMRRLGVLPPLHQVSSFKPVDEHIEILRRTRPAMFSSYAVSLELIAERVLERGIIDIRPRVVYSCAMPMSDRGRELAERAFGTPPLDVYVTVELGPVAWECPHNRGALHLNDDVQIVEILDDKDRRLPDGEVGQVVFTQLNCLAQPLIRYRLGDLAARLPSPCPCGRGLGLLSRVQGRTRHVIRIPDGRVLYGIGFGAILKTFPEVARWQAQQVAATRLRVLIVPTREWTPASAAAIAWKLVEKLGDSMHYEVVAVDDIPLAPSGKFQTIVPLDPAAAAPISPASESGLQSPRAGAGFE
jgi:phenylacetate-coenzyme A ligase PaaK-like adenylate-forming protein